MRVRVTPTVHARSATTRNIGQICHNMSFSRKTFKERHSNGAIERAVPRPDSIEERLLRNDVPWFSRRNSSVLPTTTTFADAGTVRETSGRDQSGL
jgi:hypothetical protein